MRKRIVLPLVAILATLLALAAAGPARATALDSARQPAGSSVEVAGQNPTVIADERPTNGTPAGSPDMTMMACDQPCWPDCLIQVFPCWQMWDEQYLTANNVEDMPTSCLSGRWQLGAAHYDWGFIWRATGYKWWQNLYLAAGWYGMQTCIDPHTDGWYTLSAGLYPDDPAHHPIHISSLVRVANSGDFMWGAYLDPLI